MDEAAIRRFLGGAEEGRIYRVGDTFRGLEFMVPWEQLEAGTEWAPFGDQGSYIVVAADGDGGDGGPDGGPDEGEGGGGKGEGKGEGKGKGNGKGKGKGQGDAKGEGMGKCGQGDGKGEDKGEGKGKGDGKGDGKGKPDDGNPYRMYRKGKPDDGNPYLTAGSVGSPVTRDGSPWRYARGRP